MNPSELPVPEWAKGFPGTYVLWLRLMHALGLIQQELARPDQQAKIAALVETAFTLGREAEREIARGDTEPVDFDAIE